MVSNSFPASTMSRRTRKLSLFSMGTRTIWQRKKCGRYQNPSNLEGEVTRRTEIQCSDLTKDWRSSSSCYIFLQWIMVATPDMRLVSDVLLFRRQFIISVIPCVMHPSDIESSSNLILFFLVIEEMDQLCSWRPFFLSCQNNIYNIFD